MDSYRDMSFTKHTHKAILSLICTALAVAMFSTTAGGTMYFSGNKAAWEIIRHGGGKVAERCSLRAYDESAGGADGNLVYTGCIDEHLKHIEGLYFAALAHTSGSTGYSWNYRSLTAAYKRARDECEKNASRRSGRCRIYAFAINGCIAHGWTPNRRLHGYGVGPTEEVATQYFLGQRNRDVRTCGSDCKLEKVYCTAGERDDVGWP